MQRAGKWRPAWPLHFVLFCGLSIVWPATWASQFPELAADVGVALNPAREFANQLAEEQLAAALEAPHQTNHTFIEESDGGEGGGDELLQQLWAEEHQLAQQQQQQQSGMNSNTHEAENKQQASASAPSSSILAASDKPARVLSRKRRYLIFPEGSSFQLVYDGIYGVVDYTNYLILGITVALAWELPSKAPSEILEDFQEQIVNGKLALQRRNDTHSVTYIDRVSQGPAYIDAQTLSGNRPLGHTQYYTTNNKNNNGYSFNKKGDKVGGNVRVVASPWRLFHAPLHRKYDYYASSQRTRPSSPYTSASGGRGVAVQQQQQQRYSPQRPNPLTQWRPNDLRNFEKTSRGRPANGFEFPWWHTATNRRRLTSGMQSRRRLDGGAATPGAGGMQQSAGYYQYRPAAVDTTKTTTTKKPRKKVHKKHRIYPIYGKRRRRRSHNRPTRQATAASSNADDEPGSSHGGIPNGLLARRHGTRARHDGVLDKLDRIHIRHHRWTRQTFYEKIEKYLDRRGTHGNHCVLRALCETSQRSATDRRPLSFVAELMRALFTLPEPIQEDGSDKNGGRQRRWDRVEQRYDAAQAYEGDCAERYRYCKESLWESHFVM